MLNEPAVSICMCSYRRAELLRNTLESIRNQSYPDLEIVICEDGYDGGWTRSVCQQYDARYFQRTDRPEQPYSNPSIPWNIAIRQARGRVLVLQNPECRHVGPDVIERLVDAHQTETNLAVFASVMALSSQGTPMQWYCHPKESARPFFFCGSVLREHVFAIRGFDEDFGRGVGGYGYDDDYFSACLSVHGIKFVFRDDIIVEHQWHHVPGCYGLQSNYDLYSQKMRELASGQRGPESNVGREWGSIAS